jgi:hypothetical protein
MPVVLLDVPGGDYWQHWEAFLREQMIARGLLSPDDLQLFQIMDDVEEAAAEILTFYRVFHSARFVDDHLVFRIRQPLPSLCLVTLQTEYADILQGPLEQHQGPFLAEGEEWPTLWRLVVPFIRSRYGRLRQLIDAINRV